MEDLLGELIAALLEIFGEFLLQILFELIAEATSALIHRRRPSSQPACLVGLAFAGAAAGLVSAWLFPHRLIGTRVVLPGLRLLLAPIATGAAMHFLGKQLRHLGRYTSSLVTFRGGAVFALSMALIRWLLVGLSN